MTWELALLDAQFQIADLERDALILKQRINKMKAAEKTIKQFVIENTPWPYAKSEPTTI